MNARTRPTDWTQHYQLRSGEESHEYDAFECYLWWCILLKKSSTDAMLCYAKWTPELEAARDERAAIFYLFYEFSIRPKILPYACGSILHIKLKWDCECLCASVHGFPLSRLVCICCNSVVCFPLVLTLIHCRLKCCIFIRWNQRNIFSIRLPNKLSYGTSFNGFKSTEMLAGM